MSGVVGYYRVSTELQAKTGYSLDAQRTMVRRYAAEHGLAIVAEHEEAESGYRLNRLDQRHALETALRDCRRLKATLVIAALDRLARNVVFVATLVETKIPFVALDIPGATPFMVHLYAAIAEEESRQKGRVMRAAAALRKSQGIESARTRAARAKAEALRPTFDALRAEGIGGAHRIARELTKRGVPSLRGRPWRPSVVARLLRFLGCYEPSKWPSSQTLHATAHAEAVRPHIQAARARRLTMGEVAEELNAAGHRTSTGLLWTAGRLWSSGAFRRHRAAT